MLNKSKEYPYKIDDLHKTPYRSNALKVPGWDDRTLRKKVSFNKNIYIQFIDNRDDYDKRLIRQLWWTKHELADLREQNYEIQPKISSHFLDFLLRLCDWN